MATEEPITSFPMDKEVFRLCRNFIVILFQAAEEEIALLVRKPGFDDLTVADIIRHMNVRVQILFGKTKTIKKLSESFQY